MRSTVKAIMIGLGNTGIPVAQYMVQHGVELVGAVDIEPALKGRPLSEILELECGDVHVTDDLEQLLAATKADIAVISTVSLLERVYDTALLCLNHGLNVLTTAEKAFCPGYSKRQDLVASLDAAAKANNVTMYASGVQDILWVCFATMLSGLCNRVDRIHGVNYALIDGFGPGCLEEASVGKKPEEFSAGEQLNDDFNYALHAVAEMLQLTVVSEETLVKPILAKTDVYSEEADVHVAKGDVIGVLTNTSMKTQEGIELCADFYEKLREEGDTEKNEWDIVGEPSLKLTMDEMYGEYTTCTTLVNRIPDVINAAPGFLSPVAMPMPRYHASSMEAYID